VVRNKYFLWRFSIAEKNTHVYQIKIEITNQMPWKKFHLLKKVLPRIEDI
jgi:hypothetical protein